MIRVDAELFRQVARCAEKEGGLRLYLSGVCIEPHPVAGVLLIATDGHRLICAHDPLGTTNRPSTILRLGKAGLKACKAKDTEHRALVVNWDLPNDPMRNTKPELAIPVLIEIVPIVNGVDIRRNATAQDVTDAVHIDMLFPMWRRVCPTGPFTNEGQPTWQAGYLAEFADIAAELCTIEAKRAPPEEAAIDRVGALSFEWADPFAATLVHFVRRHSAFGILMPFTGLVSGVEGYPAFFTAKAPVRARKRTQSAIPAEGAPAIAA